MTVSSVVVRAVAGWTGAENEFPTGIQVLAKSQLVVSLVPDEGARLPLTLGLHYTVALSPAGVATVVPLPAFPAVPGEVSFVRRTPMTQDYDPAATDTYDAAGHAAALDRSAMRVAELSQAVDDIAAASIVISGGAASVPEGAVYVSDGAGQAVAGPTAAQIEAARMEAVGAAGAATGAAGAAMGAVTTANQAAALADQLANAAPDTPVGSGYSSRHWVALAQALAAAFDPSAYAPLKSPAFTDTPTGPTPTGKTNSAQLATTAFVQNEKAFARGLNKLTQAGTLSFPHMGNVVTCDAATGFALTLPAAAPYAWGKLSFVNVNTGMVTLSGSIVYDGVAVTSFSLPPGAALDLVSNGTTWVITQQTLPTMTNAEWLAGVSTVDGPISPATLAAVVAAALSSRPTTLPGTLAYWPAQTPPAGWLERDGSAISRTTYAALFAVLGTTYGVGDGSTTFNLPDDRGLFDRGWDHGRGYDSGRVFGSYQVDDFKSHTHTLGQGGTDSGSNVYGKSTGGTVSTSATGGVETRPKNRAYLPIIKY